MSDTNSLPEDHEVDGSISGLTRDPNAPRLRDGEVVDEVRHQRESVEDDPVNEDVTGREMDAILGNTPDPF